MDGKLHNPIQYNVLIYVAIGLSKIKKRNIKQDTTTLLFIKFYKIKNQAHIINTIIFYGISCVFFLFLFPSLLGH